MSEIIEGTVEAENVTENQPGTALALLRQTTPANLFTPGKVTDLIEQITIEARKRVKGLDETTVADRKKMRSVAHWVAQSKTAMDGMGLDFTADLRKTVDLVNADRRRIKTAMDDLKAEITAKADAFEAAEEARLQRHKDALAQMASLSVFNHDEPTVFEVTCRLAALENFEPREWEGFTNRATDTKAAGLANLAIFMEQAQKRENDRAEAERLRQEEMKREAEEAERAKQERDRQIAAKAADFARREAEAASARVIAEERTRAAQAIEQAALETRAAEQKAAQQQEAAAQAIRDAEARTDQAKQDAEAAQVKAEANRQAYAKAAQEAKEAAVKAEIDRRAAEDKKTADAAQARADDVANRKAINSKALTAIMTVLCATLIGRNKEAEVIGKAVVTAIIKNEIPNVTISY